MRGAMPVMKDLPMGHHARCKSLPTDFAGKPAAQYNSILPIQYYREKKGLSKLSPFFS